MVRRPLVTHFKKTLLTNHTQSFSKSHHNSQLFYPIPLNLIHSPNILECSFSFWTPVLISVMSPWAFIFSRQFSNSSKSINSIFSPSRWVHTGTANLTVFELGQLKVKKIECPDSHLRCWWAGAHCWSKRHTRLGLRGTQRPDEVCSQCTFCLLQLCVRT